MSPTTVPHTSPAYFSARLLGVCAAMLLMLGACGDPQEREVKSLKEQVQRSVGQKDFKKTLDLATKGLVLARKVVGDKAPDTIYFAVGISESQLNLRNYRAAIPAMRQELNMRAAAGQDEKKLQPRRTLLIKIAEENGDETTAADQAVEVARGIEMGPGKDPQPVYRTNTMYPPDLYQQKIEGDVDIAFSLDAAGAVTEARVTKSTPPQVFDTAALDSFKSWRFTPMLDKNQRPISASGFKFTLAFRLGRK